MSETELIESIREHIFYGEKMAAIKLCHDVMGQGLKEAKTIVDNIEAEMIEEGFDFSAIPPPAEEKINWGKFFSPGFIIIALGLIIYGIVKLSGII